MYKPVCDDDFLNNLITRDGDFSYFMIIDDDPYIGIYKFYCITLVVDSEMTYQTDGGYTVYGEFVRNEHSGLDIFVLGDK